MSKSYQEIMDHVVVTEEMKKRILNNALNTSEQNDSEEDSERHNLDKDKVVSPIRWKKYRKYISMAACLAVLVIGVSVFPMMFRAGSSSSSVGSDEVVGIDSAVEGDNEENSIPAQGDDSGLAVSPATEYASIDELSDQAGFTVKELSALPFEVQETAYLLYDDGIAEISYIGSENSLYWRVCEGNADNSGDYTEYSDILMEEVNGNEVTIKGEDGKYSLAVWQDETYSYSIALIEGISENDMMAAIEAVSE